MSFSVSRKRALRSLSAMGLSPNLEVKDVRQPDFLRKVPGAADGARAITIAKRAKSAAAVIPPAAAELAVIEVDRNSRRRVKKARAQDVAFLPASAPIWLSTAARSGSTRVAVIWFHPWRLSLAKPPGPWTSNTDGSACRPADGVDRYRVRRGLQVSRRWGRAP